jgi:hypothetical protein
MYYEIMGVYQGKEGLPLVFQPRIKHWFDVNYMKGTIPSNYQGMYLDEVYEDLGVAPREVWGSTSTGSKHTGYLALKNIDSDNVEVWTRKMIEYQGKREIEYLITEFKTPVGEIRQVQRYTEHGTSLMNTEYFLKSLNDLKVFEFILGERSYKWDKNSFEWSKKRFGEIIPIRASLERIPIMWLIVGIMGFQRTITMIRKHPEEMKRFMDVLEKEHLKQIEVYKGKPVTELNFGDNMHQDLCPPPYFMKYVIPFFQRVMPKIHAEGIFTSSHWDGNVKQLLPLVSETLLDGLECVTPKPQGDVTLIEMKEGMKDMFLRDGIPAILMCPWTDVKILKRHVKDLIETFYPKLILGVSDLLPANGDIERVRVVNKIVEEFNSKL